MGLEWVLIDPQIDPQIDLQMTLPTDLQTGPEMASDDPISRPQETNGPE